MKTIGLALGAGVMSPASAGAQAPNLEGGGRPGPAKVLIVVSSHDRKGQGLVAGFWFPELTHPVKVLVDAGMAFDIASPKGGLPPFDGFDLKDEGNAWFWIQPAMRAKLASSLVLEAVDASQYAAVLLIGGHGPMWDFFENPVLHDKVRRIYEAGGVVGAVCHGPAGLLGLKLSSGASLIAGRPLTSFTHEEEVSRKYDELVPFDLERALRSAGAKFQEARPFQSKVVVDGRLITGQNPASASDFGKAVVAALR